MTSASKISGRLSDLRSLNKGIVTMICVKRERNYDSY